MNGHCDKRKPSLLGMAGICPAMHAEEKVFSLPNRIKGYGEETYINKPKG